jgi:hypothetical protein
MTNFDLEGGTQPRCSLVQSNSTAASNAARRRAYTAWMQGLLLARILRFPRYDLGTLTTKLRVNTFMHLDYLARLQAGGIVAKPSRR